MKKLVIYHGDCRDGFCAAWIAWRTFGDDAEYMAAGYGKPAPDVAGREVYILDFSYSYEETVQLIAQSASFVLLDHHKTAQEALGRIMDERIGMGKARIVFDMDRSGAGIARDVLQPGLESWLVDYTQDRDLWKFELPQSREVNAFIGTLPQTFEAYDEAHAMQPEMVSILGTGAEAYKAEYVRQMQRHAIRQTFAGYENIPVVNAPYVGISELVGALAEQEGVPFAVGWFQRGDGKVVYSLRSRGDFDVSALAQKFGGGGHKNAAGFQCEPTSLARFVA